MATPPFQAGVREFLKYTKNISNAKSIFYTTKKYFTQIRNSYLPQNLCGIRSQTVTQARPVNDGAKNAWYGVGGAWGFQESKRRLNASQRKTHDGGGQSIRGGLPVPVGLAGFCLGVGTAPN